MYKIDNRTSEDIEAKIEKLAHEYVPEWIFDKNDPDIGSTISRLFARQLEENIKSINQVPEIYHAEFVNFLDLTLKRAVPSGSVVVFKLVDTTIDGTYVPAGTLVTSETAAEDNDTPVFSTERGVYVTSSEISDIFMTDREAGTIVPLKGHFEIPDLYEKAEEEEESETQETYTDMKPFSLFCGDEADNIGKFVLGIFHSSVFDVTSEDLYVKIVGNDTVIDMINEGELKFGWLSKDGIQDFDEVIFCEDKSFKLVKNGECAKVDVTGDRGFSLVTLTAAHPIKKVLEVSDILLSSKGKPAPADHVSDANSEKDPLQFAPFTETLSVYSECYIGKDSYFDKPGSKVTMAFDLFFNDNLIDITRAQEISELKVIKKKQQIVSEAPAADVYADEISIEYFNGIGWKRLICDSEYRFLFGSAERSRVELSFTCPVDWADTSIASYEGKVLRVRLLRTDNCYMRPALHHYPMIKNLTVEYSYEDRPMHPEKLKSICASSFTDLSQKTNSGDPYTIFAPSSYAEDSLYLGFDAPIEDGPVGIFFKLESGLGQKGLKCRFDYSSMREFKRIKVLDGTEGFTHSGIVVFMPPPDFAETEIEGKRRFWLRIVRDQIETSDQTAPFMARVEEITPNAVSVINAVRSREENFYIDEVEADYRTFLGSVNILDADVWVNEKSSLISEEMKNLAKLHPEDVRIEYDMIGNVLSCFVHWHEIEQFPMWDENDESEKPWDYKRCYRLDRLTGEIIFGDGVHSEIPRVTDDTAFRVSLRTCSGEAGNVAQETLTIMPEEKLFIDSVYNPIRAYGGSNMETVSEALIRGADKICSRDRLVTASDYRKAILRFSGIIDKVSIIPGLTKDNKEDASELSIVLLMKDYYEGSFSFHRIEAQLLKYLIANSEISILTTKLHIVEPVFVSVQVTVWTEVMDMDDSFEVQNSIREVLDTYFDPVKGGMGNGWEIGTMPKKPQILMQLAGVKKQALIKKTSITVNYTDYEGEHEMDYDSLKVTPFMVCKSGKHQVNILYDRSEENA